MDRETALRPTRVYSGGSDWVGNPRANELTVLSMPNRRFPSHPKPQTSQAPLATFKGQTLEETKEWLGSLCKIVNWSIEESATCT